MMDDAICTLKQTTLFPERKEILKVIYYRPESPNLATPKKELRQSEACLNNTKEYAVDLINPLIIQE
jgi:hypothetical protein